MDMATTVIIPARNEEKTIGDIVAAFQSHPETHGHVYVGVDVDTTDKTKPFAREAGAHTIRCTVHGKGQVVWQTLKVISELWDLNPHVVLCDGDYTGLTTNHVESLLRKPDYTGMTIGVPDWPDCEVPDHVTTSWPRVSGFRYLPPVLIPANAHGYLLETQINQRAVEFGYPVTYVFMNGLKSPFQWPMTERRRQARELDREWGRQHGIL